MPHPHPGQVFFRPLSVPQALFPQPCWDAATRLRNESLFAMTTQTTMLSRSPDWRSPWERAEAPKPLSNLCHIMGGQNDSHMSKIPALHTPTAPWTELAPEANPEMFQEFEEQEDDDTFMNVGPNSAEKDSALK